jgi:hypothetical protein
LKNIFVNAWFGFVITIVCLSSCSSNEEAKQAQPQSHKLDFSERTVLYSFIGEVLRGEKFEKALPNDLGFILEPTPYAEEGWVGWTVFVGPASEPFNNYAGIATPPFRGLNGLEILGWHFRNADNTAPNDGSVNAPQEERLFSFVLNDTDYQIASETVECIMWPPLCENMDISEAIDLHQSVPKASGRLLVTQLALGNLKPGKRAWIENMEFKVELELPASWNK